MNNEFLCVNLEREVALAIGDQYKQNAVDQMKRATMLCVMFDAGTDITTREKLGIEVRYVHNGRATNSFLTSDFCDAADAKTESMVIRKALKKLELPGTCSHF